MFPIQQRAFGNPDAFGKFTLGKAGFLADLHHINIWNLDIMQARARGFSLGVIEGFVQRVPQSVGQLSCQFY